MLELVVVVAITALLTAIALPRFANIQKDAKISQVKNTLTSIIKECKIAELREQRLEFRYIASANGQLPSYLLKSGTVLSTNPSFFSRSCYVPSSSGAPSIMEIMAETTDKDPSLSYGLLPGFSISYDSVTGKVTKTCTFEDYSDVYKSGCDSPVYYGGLWRGTWN